MQPKLSVELYDPVNNIPSVLLERELYSLNIVSRELFVPIRVPVKKSFGVLLVKIEAWPGARVRALHDGCSATLKREGNVATLGIQLENDLELHFLSVSVDTSYALTVLIEVCHQYRLLTGGGSVDTPKWSLAKFYQQYDLWHSYFRPKSTQALFADFRLRRLEAGFTSDAAEQELFAYQIVLRLLRIVSRASKRDLWPDFSYEEEAGVADVQGTIDVLKANTRFLVEKVAGPISIGGRSYTAVVQLWESEKTKRIDLSVLLTVLEYVERRLIFFSFSMITIEMIGRVRLLARQLSDIRRGNVSAGDMRAFFRSRMKSPIGGEIQKEGERLVAVLGRALQRTEPQEKTFGGLWCGRRDWEIFEDLVYAGVGLALGYDWMAIKNRPAKLDTRQDHLINVNAPGGRGKLAEVLAGWRTSSIQPSEFAPDLIVLHGGSIPVLVDAKFRIGRSLAEVANAGALAEIQAYLDEFSLASAVIVVPLIAGTLDQSRAALEAIKGSTNQRAKAIYVIQMSNCTDEAFQGDLVNAIHLCANLNGSVKSQSSQLRPV